MFIFHKKSIIQNYPLKINFINSKLFKKISIFAVLFKFFIKLTLTINYRMKKFFLSCTFFLLTTLAFAQGIEEKAVFLTDQMTTLLSLSNEQVERVSSINTRRFTVEKNMKTRLADNARYQNAKSENFETTSGQHMQQELNDRIEKGENRYDLVMNKILDDSQYVTYLQNKTALLNAVVTEFGE